MFSWFGYLFHPRSAQCPMRGPGLSHFQEVDEVLCRHCGVMTYKDEGYVSADTIPDDSRIIDHINPESLEPRATTLPAHDWDDTEYWQFPILTKLLDYFDGLHTKWLAGQLD